MESPSRRYATAAGTRSAASVTIPSVALRRSSVVRLSAAISASRGNRGGYHGHGQHAQRQLEEDHRKEERTGAAVAEAAGQQERNVLHGREHQR